MKLICFTFIRGFDSLVIIRRLVNVVKIQFQMTIFRQREIVE